MIIPKLIAGSKETHKSLPALANLIVNQFPVNPPSCCFPEQILIDRLIRYGNTTSLPHNNVLNTERAIMLTSNKRLARQIMIENKIHTIGFAKGPPCIIRPIHHSRGKQFYVCYNSMDITKAMTQLSQRKISNSYASEIFNKTKEYRIHITRDGILAVQEKTRPQINTICWNHRTGSIFNVLRRSDVTVDILKECNKCLEIFNLDFGAIDVLLNSTEFVICEINTAPRLEGYITEKYQNYFSNWLDNNKTYKITKNNYLVWRNNVTTSTDKNISN